MTIFEELRIEHELQRNLISQLLDTSGDSGLRQKLFGQLKVSLAAHAASEERYFYKTLIEYDLTQEKARHSMSEHKELDDYVEELESIDMSSPGWLTTFKKMAGRLEHHLSEEEHEIFPVAGKVLSGAEKKSLATSYRSHIIELEKVANA